MKKLTACFAILLQICSTIFANKSFAGDPNYVYKTIEDTICGKDYYDFYGRDINKSGLYDTIIPALNGNDTLVFLYLTILNFVDIDNHSIIINGSEEENQLICSGNIFIDLTNMDELVKAYYTASFFVGVRAPDSTFTGIAFPGSRNSLPYSRSIYNTGEYIAEVNIRLKEGEHCHPYNRLEIRKKFIIVANYEYKDITKTICEGSSYYFYGDTITQEGVYVKSIPSEFGCDTVATLELSLASTFDKILRDTISQNEPYNKNGFDIRPYEEAGDYEHELSLLSLYGCDSIVKLCLNVNNPNLEINLEPIDEICGNNADFTLGFRIMNGAPTHYSLHFESKASERGFISVELVSLNADNKITIPIPAGVIPDNYSMTITFYNAYGISFTLPVEFTINPANLSEITIENTHEICADDEGFAIRFTVTTGEASHYSLHFDDKALERGFTDVEYRPLDDTNEIFVAVPENTLPDIYNATLYFYDICGSYKAVPLEFTINYPASILEQKWKDVIAVLNERYNGGYTFSQFQWYVNDNPINGQTGSNLYIHEGLQLGAEYRALLTRTTDNVTLLTCPFIPMDLSFELNIIQEPDISSYKNVLTITVEQDYDAVIWNEMGLKMGDLKLKADKNEFTLNYPPGMYIIEILDFKNKSFYRRFIIR